MPRDLKEKLKPIFEGYPKIKLVYLFGSQANGENGPLSDFDLAVYLIERDRKKIFEVKTELLNQISRILGTDRVDIVILNQLQEPELKFNIINEGKIIFERDLTRVLVEPKILTEYFDFRRSLRKYHLTKT